jgi:hypothetical protein
MGDRDPRQDSPGLSDASQHGRGWLPLVGMLGNNVFFQVDTVIAARLRRAWEVDQQAPLVVAGMIDEILRDYLEAAVPLETVA